MKNFCFITSHFYSGSSNLIKILNQNPRCEFKTGSDEFVYDHPDILNPIINQKSKVFGDHILKNYNLSSESFYKFAKFIYVIRPPRQTFNEFYHSLEHGRIKNFSLYYRFRLRRICEMARKTKNSLVLNWDDLKNKKALPVIEDYLGVDLHWQEKFFIEFENNFENETLIKEANKSYEKYHYFLKNLKSIKRI